MSPFRGPQLRSRRLSQSAAQFTIKTKKKGGGGPRPAAVAKAHEKKTNPAPTQKATTDRPTKNDGQLPALPGPATRWWGRALGTSSSSLLKEYTQPTEPRGTRLEHHHRQPPTTGCRTHKRNEHHVLLERGGGGWKCFNRVPFGGPCTDTGPKKAASFFYASPHIAVDTVRPVARWPAQRKLPFTADWKTHCTRAWNTIAPRRLRVCVAAAGASGGRLAGDLSAT